MVSNRRGNHSWDPSLSTREDDGTLTSRCKNCGLTQRHGWYLGDTGRVLDVIQWVSPRDVLLGIRPIVMFGAPRTAPSMAEAFGDIPVRKMPACPKEREAWDGVTVLTCW